MTPARAFSVLLLTFTVACGWGADILPGLGAAGIELGDDRAAVERALGRPERTESSGVQGAQRKEAIYLLYPSKGIDVLLLGGKVQSLFLYQEGMDDHRKYSGRTPEGLTLSSTRDEILSALGDPSARGLGDAANRWFRYDSGIEFSFLSTGQLHHIVITHPR